MVKGRRKPSKRRYGKAASAKVASTGRQRKRATPSSGRTGRKVTSRKRTAAVGLSQGRKSGAKAPAKAKKRSSAR
jgi:hypothetical protein